MPSHEPTDSRDRRRHRSPSYDSEEEDRRRRERRRREREREHTGAREGRDRSREREHHRRRRDDDDDEDREERERYRRRGDSPRRRSPQTGEERRERRRERKREEEPSGRRHREHQRPRRERDEYGDKNRDSRSPPPRRSNRASRSPRSRSPQPTKRSRAPLPSQEASFKGDTDPSSALDKPPEKQLPNFAPTGALAAETNTVPGSGGVVLKYNEPAEARKPPARDAWRLYVFKGADVLETVELGGRSCWLFGRERLVADFPIDHPSCSKQHAVLQFRWVSKVNEFGDRDGKVRPYLIDLESANGTTVNGERIPATRYVELMDKDVIQFGQSTREYVLMLPPPG